MKPVKLIMSAFGPFPDIVEIDFTRFEREGLFLLSGETGAGKTTIFDAVSYALYGEVSGDIRGKDNLRSDFAKPETDTFVRLYFEHKDVNYSIYRSPKYERPKLRGLGTTRADAAVEFILPERVITKIPEANAEIETLLAVTYNQFKQIIMIAQGEFLALITANSDERTAIMRRVFGTSVYEKIQIKLKEKSDELKKEYENLKAEQSRLEKSFISADIDTSHERLVLLAKRRGEIKTEIDSAVVKIELAKQYNSALNSLEINSKKLEENKKAVDIVENDISILKESEPLHKQSEILRAEIESALPKYAEFTKKSSELIKITSKLFDVEKEHDKISARINSEKSELIQVKSYIESLVSAETDAMAADNGLSDALERLNRLKTLETSHKNWIKKNDVYISAQKEYFFKKRLFDDSLAGRLAENLKDGEACPVCGSTEHLCLAKKQENAPTQTEYENCEKIYEKARADIISANEKQEMLSVELGVSFEEITENINAQTQKVFELEDKKKSADESVRQLNISREREKQLAENIDKMSENIKILSENAAELKISVEIAKLEIITSKKELKHESEEAAKNELEKIKSEIHGFEKEIQKKSLEYQILREASVSFNTLIENSEKSLKEVSGRLNLLAEFSGIINITNIISISELEESKITLEKESVDLENKERAALSSKETNERVQAELTDCNIKLEAAGKRFGEADLLSKTANGNLSGRNKLRFETYVQQVYFDMVLSAASVRFNIMTDGQFELVRQSGDKLQGRTGLDVDVFDSWTQTTRPAKTLSGGQCFKAALALALGLADVVQSHSGGIQIDAMFIDEGFGSLDSESLDSVMDIIGSLADGKRLVGIISHVDTLKERVTNKIIVERDKAGSKIHVIS